MSRMRQRAATIALILTTATTCLVATSPAANASGTDIGRISTTGSNVGCSGDFSLVQAYDSAGTTYGTDSPAKITAWATLGGAYASSSTRALQVWRPVAGTASTYRLVFESAPQSMYFTGVRSFDLADPFTMQPGDRLGFQQTGYTVNCADYIYPDGGLALSFGDSVVGSTYTFNTNGYYYSLNVTAHLEPADSTAPVITPHVSPAGPDGANGWYTSSPTVSFDVTDPESAVTATSAGCAGGTVSTDTAGTTFTCAATSAGGTATQSATLKRDATAPTATFDDAPAGLADGATYTWGSVPAAPTCTATDALSGPDGCTVSGYSTDVGTHTLVATATDQAGNTATGTRTYTVAPWRTSGFYQPIDMSGVFNIVKNGSTVPIKFAVYAGDTKVTDPSKVTFSAAKVTCATGAPEDAVEVTATGATSLRYDSTGGQFIYNWATPQTAGVCYALTMTTADGTSTKALFKLK